MHTRYLRIPTPLIYWIKCTGQILCFPLGFLRPFLRYILLLQTVAPKETIKPLMEECHWGRRGQEPFYLVMQNSGRTVSPGAMALKLKLQMSSCAVSTAVPHLLWAHHPISESFCGKYHNVIHHAMLPHVCFSLHLCTHPRCQSAGCVGSVGCAGMSGLGGQGIWLADVHQCLMSIWKHSTAWTKKLEVKTVLVTYILPEHPCLQLKHYLSIWKFT